MKQMVGYIKDNSRVEYKTIPSIYSFVETEIESCDKYDVVIIDQTSLDDGLKIINAVEV